MKTTVKSAENHLDRKTVAIIASAVGLAAYLAISLIFSQIRFPNLDEGAYLYKGLQFAEGNYRPFQAYGFWTNKMYLPFYFYGWIQLLFKPGLLAPRLLAVVLGTMSVAGLWIVIRRISNDYFAAIAVWAMALNATMVSIYSIGNSQVVVICELIWILVLVLGENRKLWQILLGAFIAGLMVFTRENMIFVLPFLALYIFWQHGRRNGWLAFTVMSMVIVIGHLLFWPDILYLWGRQIPFFRVPTDLGKTVNSVEVKHTVALSSRLHSLSIALRVFFLPISILGLAIANWKKKAVWEKPWQYKAALFLTIMLVILVVVHILASAGQNYCVYCTTNYFAFFVPVCLILFPLIIPLMKRKPSWISTVVTSFFVILFTTIIGFSSFEQTGYSLMNLQVPRLKEGRILEGSVHLWQMFTNKFHLDYELIRMMTPALFGFLLGLFLIILLLILQVIQNRRHKTSVFMNLGMPFLILGFICTAFLSWPTQETFSKSSVTNLYSQIGKQLASVTRPGEKTYIDGSITSIPLLYASDVQILPGQVNSDYALVEYTNSDEVAKIGFWNEQMARDWKKQSELFIVGGDKISQWYDYIENKNLKLISEVNYAPGLPEYVKIYIFIRDQ